MAGAVAVECAEQQVVLDAHFGEQFALLRDQRHAVADQFLDLAFTALGRAHVNDFAGRRQQAHQRRQQGRLAGTVGADDGDDLAPANGQADIVQRLDLAVGDTEVADVEDDLVLVQVRVLAGHAHSTPPR